MFTCKTLEVRLDLFDGGAAAPAPAGPSEGGSQALPGPTRRGKTGGEPAPKVVYGKQAAPEGEERGPDAGDQKQTEGEAAKEAKPAEEPPEERKARFKALVEGEFKDLYTEETQRIIDARFRDVKTLQEQMNAHKPILDLLAQRYHVDDGDPAKLAKAIEADDAYWTAAAEEAGMSVEQYKDFARMQRENESLKEAQRRQQREEASRRQLDTWMADAEKVREAYPEFDLNAEVKDPQFLKLLRSGIPMQKAYEVLHMDLITGQMVQKTAQETEKKVVDGIRAKGARPVEGGVPQGGVLMKTDVSKLTRKDRAEIARRVARGERIEF